MYKNIFFDFDGTLFNGYPKMIGAMMKMLKEKRDTQYKYDDLFKMCMVSFYYLGQMLHLSEDEWARYTEICETDTTLPPFVPFEGVKDALEKLTNAGVKCFIYTNRNIKTIDYMKEFDLDKYIVDYVCDARKPDPTLLDAMIEKYKLDKKECLVVGDRTLDLEGAIASSLDSFSLNSYKKEELATYQGQTFDELLKVVI